MLELLDRSSVAACFLILCTIAGLYLWRNRTAKYAGIPLPPGPPRLPLVGNLLQMPKSHDWLTYEAWAKEFGSDVLHVDVLGRHIVVLNSIKAATELFEHRPSIYSDRPIFTVIRVLLGFDWGMAFCRYNDRLRTSRKRFEEFLRPAALKEHHSVEIIAVHELLSNLVNRPDDFMAHLRHMAGKIIMELAYGIHVKSTDDPHIESAEQATNSLSTSIAPAARIFDFFSMLICLPSWFPGASYKKYAKRVRHWSVDTRENPWRATKEAMAEGKASPSFAARTLSQLELQPSPTEESIGKDVAASMYLGGADTTVCALGNFILSMVLYPESQKKAQAEIDSIIGPDRLPSFKDKDSLPYVNALVAEVLRWRNVLPLDLPRGLWVDDVYAGYLLPAGSVVIANIWAMLHEETVYGRDALEFRPERFLDKNLPFPEIVFGFGRRQCPGRHLARESVWLAIVSMLATLDISKAKDEQGNTIEPMDGQVPGIIPYPLPFRCHIQARSTATAKLIQMSQIIEM